MKSGYENTTYGQQILTDTLYKELFKRYQDRIMLLFTNGSGLSLVADDVDMCWRHRLDDDVDDDDDSQVDHRFTNSWRI